MQNDTVYIWIQDNLIVNHTLAANILGISTSKFSFLINKTDTFIPFFVERSTPHDYKFYLKQDILKFKEGLTPAKNIHDWDESVQFMYFLLNDIAVVDTTKIVNYLDLNRSSFINRRNRGRLDFLYSDVSTSKSPYIFDWFDLLTYKLKTLSIDDKAIGINTVYTHYSNLLTLRQSKSKIIGFLNENIIISKKQAAEVAGITPHTLSRLTLQAINDYDTYQDSPIYPFASVGSSKNRIDYFLKADLVRYDTNEKKSDYWDDVLYLYSWWCMKFLVSGKSNISEFTSVAKNSINTDMKRGKLSPFWKQSYVTESGVIRENFVYSKDELAHYVKSRNQI